MWFQSSLVVRRYPGLRLTYMLLVPWLTIWWYECVLWCGVSTMTAAADRVTVDIRHQRIA